MLLLLCYFAFSIAAAAQSKKPGGGTLSGYVEDALTGERLIGVTVAAPFSGGGTATNNYGFYILPVPADTVRIVVSYTGYEQLDTLIDAGGGKTVSFRLRLQSRLLDEVTVSGSQRPALVQSSQMSFINLTAGQLEVTPRFFGEADLLKTLQMMPGIKQGTEGTTALLVRGGTPDQNLILLDGATLYNPMHMLGIFSTFNTSVLKDVTLYKGAFPARFGGRISSVVDISMKDGNMHEMRSEFSIGLLAMQGSIEGPIKKGKSSFILSARRTYPDLIIAPVFKILENDLEKYRMYFYDLNAKFQHTFSDKDKIYLSLYGGRDQLLTQRNKTPGKGKNTFTSNIQWGNITATMRWNHVFNPRLFSNTVLIGTRYQHVNKDIEDYNLSNRKEDRFKKLLSGISDYGARTDFEYQAHPAHAVRFGASYLYKIFNPGVITDRWVIDQQVWLDTVSSSVRVSGHEADLYVEDDWTVSPEFKLNAGVRLSAFGVRGKLYHTLQPRLSMRYLLPGGWALKASYSEMAQYIHLLSGNSISLPTDLWVPATEKIAPQQARHYALGIASHIFKNKFEFSLEGYYKATRNVIEYKEGVKYILSTQNGSWEDQVATGNAEAYGMEMMLQKKTGRLTGWVAYTLGWSYRTLPDINLGRRFPYKYDRRHDFHITAMYKLSKRIELDGAFTFQSAAPFTLPVARYEGMPEVNPARPVNTRTDALRINSRNSFRLDPYHRLDVGINFIKEKKNGNKRIWNVSVINVYNKFNAYHYYVSDDYMGERSELRAQAVLPLLPSVTYILKIR